MNIKQIDGEWFVCRDGWVFHPATNAEVISHLFNMTESKFNSIIES